MAPAKKKAGNPNWVKGGLSPNPGGKPKKLVEIERMLDEEHRSVENMREVFARLKALSMGEKVFIKDDEGEIQISLKADAHFMKLYLERIMGAVPKPPEDEKDTKIGELHVHITEQAPLPMPVGENTTTTA